MLPKSMRPTRSPALVRVTPSQLAIARPELQLSEAEPRSAIFACSSAEQSETSPALAEGFATTVPFEHSGSVTDVAVAVVASPERTAKARTAPAPSTSRNEAANEA